MPPESEFTRKHPDCPNPEAWSARDGLASEDEVGTFLYGLVRLFKPARIAETGSYLGDTTYQLGLAAKDNGFGVVMSCDTDPGYIAKARKRCEGLPVTIYEGDSLIFIPIWTELDLAFLDSNAGRLEEAKALKLSNRALVVLHDARWPERDQIKKELGWNDIFIPCPRGLSIFEVNRGAN